MVTISYHHRAWPARNARWSQRYGRIATIIEVSLGVILVAASLYQLHAHHASGWSLLGLSLLVGITYIWHHGQISRSVVVVGALNKDSIQLEKVTERNLLARLAPDMTVDQLWRAAATQWEGGFILQRLGMPLAVVADLLGQQAPSSEVVWQKAVDLGRQLNVPEIDSGVVISAIILATPQLAPALAHLKLTPEDVLSVLEWQQRSKALLASSRKPEYFGGIGRDWANGYTPLLSRFASNLSQEIERGYHRHIPTIHEDAINRLADQLDQNRAAVLVGGVGSGRTSIVYALAERMLTGQLRSLQYYQVMELNASVLLSSGGRIEDVVMQLLNEAVHASNIILFLDEAQLFFGDGPGAVDLSQILLPILQRNVVKLVFALSDHDWQALVARQPALAASLQRIVISEPHPDETVRIVQDAAIGIEHKAKAIVMQTAVSEAIRLAGRYLPETAFPGKAITVLDGASHYAQGGLITATSVQQAIESTTGAKVVAASQPERQQLLDLESQIHQRMINQTRAVKVVADALRRSRAGVSNPKRPIGSFLFLGPTGVGKTELAKALAAIYFGGSQSMVRLDMSEYQQQSDLSRLLSPSSGAQAGATLASGVRQRPSSVVLLDEIEKAHPDVLNLLLQLLDEGQLTDTDGRQVSFKDTIVIATSNAAADEIRSRIAKGEQLENFEAAITGELISSHVFRPELLNRFDDIVLFRPLTKAELHQVVGLMLNDVNATLQTQRVRVALTPAATDWLVEQGYDPALGARPLRRTVQRTVENIVAQRLLAGNLVAGQAVTLDQPDLAAPTQPQP
jgi:ATP-dependent Clp protease ATP-binding subunit ClpC